MVNSVILPVNLMEGQHYIISFLGEKVIRNFNLRLTCILITEFPFLSFIAFEQKFPVMERSSQKNIWEIISNDLEKYTFPFSSNQ